jgi:nucleotide-binding universal stress UspA family protein
MPIVVGVDETPVSERVLRKAIDEAKLRDEPLHVVHVYHPPLMYFATTLSEPVDFAAHHRDKVWERLAPLLEMSHIQWERVDLDGYPGDVLNDYANNVHASLIIIGTRGRGDLSSLLLGSTSHRVAHIAACDVLIVKT